MKTTNYQGLILLGQGHSKKLDISIIMNTHILNGVKRSLAFLFIFCVLHPSYGVKTYELKGVVLDSLSLDSLGLAVVVINNKALMVTNKHGWFSLKVLEGDSIRFSHLGYISPSFYLSTHFLNDTSRHVFYLNNIEYEIREVKVFSFSDYTSFKQAFLEKGTSDVLINTIEHTKTIHDQILYGYEPSHDSYTNYRIEIRDQIKPREPVTIQLYSSQGGFGIGALINKLKKKK